VIFSPVAAYLVGVFGLLSTYKILGMAFFIVLVFSSFFMNKKPASGGIQPELSDAAKKDKSWIEMIRTPVFYIILLLMTIGATCGLLITSQASIMAQIMVGAGITEAAFAVSMFAGANTAGRFIWGVLSDKMGRINALYCIFLFTALSMLGLSFVRGEQFVFFVFLIAMIAFCYGGIMGTFPALVTEHFGNKSNGANYGLVLQGVSVGGFIGPLIAAFTQTVTPGDFNFAFYIAAALSTLGLILVFMLKKFS